MKNTVFGILAHVDAGKTTLSEQLLLAGGVLRAAGRVDKGTSFLDNNSIERDRGITVFSKQAELTLCGRPFTLLDTPGHADFSGEAERVLSVLDAAILIVSAGSGVNGHTVLLKKLLDRYTVPTIIFVNKADLLSFDRERLLAEIREKLGTQCVAAEEAGLFENHSTGTSANTAGSGMSGIGTHVSPEAAEDIAVLDENIMESYLDTGTLPEGAQQKLFAEGKFNPVYFGAALKNEGVDELIGGLVSLTAKMAEEDDAENAPGGREGSAGMDSADHAGRKAGPAGASVSSDGNAFSARVFGIRNADRRLTTMKITGGSLSVRDEVVTDGTAEKVTELRVYSGEKYTSVKTAAAGDVVAACGLEKTYAGQGIGHEADALQPAVVPVMRVQVIPAEGVPEDAFREAVRTLAEEEPGLGATEEGGAFYFSVMGALQEEILASIFENRFAIGVSFGPERPVYAETIAGRVEGVGHYEPLRHYSEVHLMVEGGEAGSGIVLKTACPTDVLEKACQRQVFDVLAGAERAGQLVGVLTGAPLTDITITLVSGRSHVKHTEPGDFAEAALRALRNGLMRAENVLLEPVLSFTMRVPASFVGRALTDVSAMDGQTGAPEVSADGTASVLTGTLPAANVGDYPAALRAATGGEGSIELTPAGYRPAARAAGLLAECNYDPDRDVEHPAGSIFCVHGAGTYVDWEEAGVHMHLPMAVHEVFPGAPDAWVRADGDSGNPGATGGEPGLFSGGEGGDAGRPAPIGPGVGWIPASALAREPDAAPPSAFASGGGPARGNGEDLVSIMNSLGKSANQKAKPRGRDRDIAAKRKREEELSRKRAAIERSQPYKGKEKVTIADNTRPDLLLVDGYNIIFSWDELKELASVSIDAARGRLNEILSNYAGYAGCETIVVYDAYLLENHAAETLKWHNIHVVFTATAETADQYIEQAAIARKKDAVVSVATSDRVERVIVLSQGATVLSAENFRGVVDAAVEAIREKI